MAMKAGLGYFKKLTQNTDIGMEKLRWKNIEIKGWQVKFLLG